MGTHICIICLGLSHHCTLISVSKYIILFCWCHEWPTSSPLLHILHILKMTKNFILYLDRPIRFSFRDSNSLSRFFKRGIFNNIQLVYLYILYTLPISLFAVIWSFNFFSTFLSTTWRMLNKYLLILKWFVMKYFIRYEGDNINNFRTAQDDQKHPEYTNLICNY